MKAALVTGASSGIGRATVRRLDGAGRKVFAGVRKEEDAAALRTMFTSGTFSAWQSRTSI